LFEFLRAQARDASALESERLLYVACTRAKRQLMLTATLANSKPRAGSLLAVLWPVIGDEFEPPVAPAGEMAPGGEMAQAIPRGGPLLRVPAGWSPATDRQLHGDGHFPAAAAPPRVETPVFDWAGETARRVGSLVHAQLQSLDLAATGPASIRAREPDFRRWLALQGVPAERLREAAGRAVEALVAVYGDPRARWILSHGYRDDFREYAISGLWEGGLVHAVFDRSFIDADDVRWVIDYKTSQHAGGRLEEFLDREVERYRPQLQRYAGLARQLGPEPVRVGLYFPLMRAWREWTP
jgi:ATP-dependent exoDNAse (exonuclease V) beta subunit